MTDAELINLHGGPARLAEKLGWHESRALQRIHNWRTRGIPAAIKLKYQHLFLLPQSEQMALTPKQKEVAHG